MSVTNPYDPSATDTATGFRYAFDFDNDGTFEIGDGTYIGSTTNTSATVPAAYFADGAGSRTIRVRVLDKDGGYTDYTATIDITNVAPSATGVVGPVTLGINQPGTFTLTNPSDPSSIDATSLRFSFATSTADLDADYASASTTNSYTTSFPLGGPQTIYARTYDKDGGISDTYTLSTVVGHVFIYDGDLYVYGTSGNDTIWVSDTRCGAVVRINGDWFGTLHPTGTIRVFGLEGNDYMFVDATESRPAVLSGAEGNDLVIGGRGLDTLDGGDGNDTLVGGRGSGQLLGGAGNDWLEGNSGRDSISGGDGNDILIGSRGANTLSGDAGDDVFLGWGSTFVNDILQGGPGYDRIVNPAGGDQLILDNFGPGLSIEEIDGTPRQMDQQVTGTNGNNTLDFSQTKLRGISTIDGNGGNDLIVASSITRGLSYTGSDGDDTLVSGSGADRLEGGGGKDIFRYEHAVSGSGLVINDFREDHDRIDLSALGVKYFASAPPTDGTAWVSATRSGFNTILTIHFPDGTTMEITLRWFGRTLDATDFILA